MARTRDLAPYPSPSPKLYDEEVPKLEDQDLRDGYDKQFRINQRLKRWGIVIADIINALDIGAWDPSTKIVIVGDGEDADYTTIDEALLSISPSSYDPRIIIVYPGVYFDRLYIPAYTTIVGIGNRDDVKIRIECNAGEAAIEGGNNHLHFINLDIQQTSASVANTRVIDLAAMNIRFKNVRVENLSTSSGSEGVVVDEISYSTAGPVEFEDVHIKGNNSDLSAASYAHLTYDGVAEGLWYLNGATPTHANQNTSGVSLITDTAWSSVAASSPFGDASVYCNAASGGNGLATEVMTGAQADAATAVVLDCWIKPGLNRGDEGELLAAFDLYSGEYYGLFVNRDSDNKLRAWIGKHNFTTDVDTKKIEINGGSIPPNIWARVSAAYNKTSGDFFIYVNGEPVGYANTILTDIYSGQTQIVYANIGTYKNMVPPNGYWSDFLFSSTYKYEWDFGLGEADPNIATLRVASQGANKPSRVELKNVIVENTKSNKNIILGDTPFIFQGVTTLFSNTSAGKNILIRNDGRSSTPHTMTSVSMFNGEKSLVLEGIHARVSLGHGVYGNRPTSLPSVGNIIHTRGSVEPNAINAPNLGPLTASELFIANDYFGETNILNFGEVDAGHVMPPAPTQWFENVGVDGDLQVTGNFNVDGNLTDDPLVAKNFAADSGHFWRRIPRLEGSEPKSWDLEDEDWEDITDWTSESTGTNTIEESPSGQLHLKAGDGSGTNSYAQKYKNSVITSESEFTVEILMKFDQLANYGTEINDSSLFQFYNGTNEFYIRIFKDKIFYYNGAWAVLGLDAISTGTWYNYRFLCDSNPSTLKVYRNTTLVGTKTDAYVGSGDNGRVRLAVRNYSTSPTETEAHFEHTKIAVGLYPPYTETTVDIDPTLINDNIDTGFVMPEPSTKHFNDVQLREIEVQRALEVGGEIFADGFAQINNWDIEGFITPTTERPLSRMRAYANAAQDIINGTWTKVELNTENFDTLDEFASYRFTAKYAGYYHITASLVYSEAIASGSSAYMAIYKNGTIFSYSKHGIEASTDVPDLNLTDLLSLKKDDYLELYTFHSHTEARLLAAGSDRIWMSVARLP